MNQAVPNSLFSTILIGELFFFNKHVHYLHLHLKSNYQYVAFFDVTGVITPVTHCKYFSLNPCFVI